MGSRELYVEASLGWRTRVKVWGLQIHEGPKTTLSRDGETGGMGAGEIECDLESVTRN